LKSILGVVYFSMDDKLTERQEEVLKKIRDFYLDNGYAPSLGELQELLNISTKRGVVNHLRALEKKGYIIRTNKARGIHVVKDQTEESYEYLVGVPILGYANAGTPISLAQEENLGTLQIDKTLVKGKESELFALIIKGDSMNMKSINGRNLEDGHYVVVQKDSDYNDGDAVVAIIDGCATVKNIKKSKNMVILYPQSSNSLHKPIYLDAKSNSIINGKVIMVLDNPNV